MHSWHHHLQHFLLKFTAFTFGCLSCWVLQHDLGFSAVSAAATVGLVGSFYHFSRPVERAGVHGAIYAGAFAGMSSIEHLPSWSHVIVISLIGTCVYFWFRPRFLGFGGKLGFVAMVASLLLIFSRRLM